jgi:hypothetical protein
MNTKTSIPTATLRQSAFTLVEAMVGTVVTGIAVVSLYAGFSYGFLVTEATRENLRATQLMMEKFETIRLYTWQQVNGTNHDGSAFIIPSPFTNYYVVGADGETGSGTQYIGTMTLSEAPLEVSYKENLKLVTVRMEWTSGRVLRSRMMTSFVAKEGMQTYVY